MKFIIPATLLVCLAVTGGCRKGGTAKHDTAEPAQVAHHVEEESLNTITLTEKAEGRLGIQLAEVRKADVRRRRTFGGEVVVPTGQTVIVSAPLAGTLSAPEGGAVPPPGANLAAGQPLFDFKPLLTPERDVLTPAERVRVAQTRADVATTQIEAQRQVEAAKVQVEAAQIAFDRATELLKNKAGSQRSVDEAEAHLKIARQAQETAEARHAFLSQIELDEEAGELAPRTITSPVAGVLQNIDAAAGETVAAGEPLFHVVRMDRLWIRVPVYVGNWREIDTTLDAAITEYGQPADQPPRPARYVAAPPSADSAATTVDLFYELANNDGRLYPGQKLAVTVPLQSTAASRTVPRTAVLYDVNGGAWVYEQLGPQTYARRRVAVNYAQGADAVLAAGPPAGTKVVTEGAVELFGTEFGVGH